MKYILKRKTSDNKIPMQNQYFYFIDCSPPSKEDCEKYQDGYSDQLAFPCKNLWHLDFEY